MGHVALGENLARLRRSGGLSQAALAEAVGISRQAYRNIEAGSSEPRVATLNALAEALGVPVRELLRPVRGLRHVRFRSDKKLTSRGQVLTSVERWLEDYCQLEELLGERPRPKLSKPRSGASPVECAGWARRQLKLGETELIHDVCGLLEDSGIKVYRPEVASEGFFGLSVGSKDGGPAVVVNTWERISVERWIFSAAHELGHLVQHLDAYDVDAVDEDEKQEAEADQFASHFLMPAAVFSREWEQARGRPFVDRVLKLKQIFRVSYKTVLYRLSESSGDSSIWKKFAWQYKKQTGRSLTKHHEPDQLDPSEFLPATIKTSEEPERVRASAFMDDRLWRLVRKGVEDEAISLSRGAEILGLSAREMREVAAGWVE